MNNVVFYRKLISLLELKLNEELKKEGNRSFQLNNEMSNLLFFKTQNGHELHMMENLMYMIFGYRYNEIKDQIIQEQEVIRNEMKDLDDYVNELRKHPVLPDSTFQVKPILAGEQNVIETLKEHFKDSPNVTVVDVNKKWNIDKTYSEHVKEFGRAIVFETAGDVKELDDFSISRKHFWKENVGSFPIIESSRRKGKTHFNEELFKEIVFYNTNYDIQSKIKKIIPVINDNFVLKQRLDNLKKIEQRLKKLPKSERGELVQIQKQINTIKSWL